jgi:lysophospholipase L1-like esterase
MTRLGRRGWVRWPLRIALAVATSELWLSIGAQLLEARGSGSVVSSGAQSRILCVGDSNTFGVGAPKGASYPDQLQKLLAADHPGHEVVNLGVPGFTSRMIVDHLEQAVRQRPPECVVFLGGFNDLARSDQLLEVPPEVPVTLSMRLHAWLSWSRTFRVVETACRMARGDLGHEEIGGSSAAKSPPPPPAPDTLKTEQEWSSANAKARELGGTEYFDWLVANWKVENPDHLQTIWNELRASPLFERVKSQLCMPVSHYEWELAMLRREEPPPLAVHDGEDESSRAFDRFTRAYALLRDGKCAEARAAFSKAGLINRDVWGQSFLDLHVAWTWLVERDFARADRELDAVLTRNEQISPPIGIHHALGGAALAWLLHDEGARLGAWMERHGTAWKEHYWWSQSPDGHEWVLAAEWVDAVKSGDAKLLKDVTDRAKWRVAGEPHTKPLRWLVDHPKATFAQIRDGLELGPPRVSWFAPLSWFFRRMEDDEFARLSKRSFDRLAQLSLTRGFPVVVMTYLNDDEGPARRVNRQLRLIADEHHWPLVDLHADHSEAELTADDKRRYFSADRGHPNEAGYALIARAVEATLVAQHVVQ